MVICGLVTGGISNEVCLESCSKAKKVPSRFRGMSKLSVSQCKIEDLTQVNYCFKTGSTLPQLVDIKLGIRTSGFSDLEFRRVDSDPRLYTCTDKNLFILAEYFQFLLDCIIVQYGNPRKYLKLNLIFIKIKVTFIFISTTNYGYLSIFYTLNTFTNLKYFHKIKVYTILNLHQFFSRLYCQEVYCQDGVKKSEKSKDLGNSWCTYRRKYFYNRPGFYKLGEKLNSVYLNSDRKVSYRYYCAQDSFNVDRLNNSIREWPNNKVLLKLKSEVTQEQIALVDLAKSNGLYYNDVKNFQIRLMKSLKFRIIAVYEISKNKSSKTVGIDNVNFLGDIKTKRKIYWETVEALRKITYYPRKYKASPIKRIFTTRSCRQRCLFFLFHFRHLHERFNGFFGVTYESKHRGGCPTRHFLKVV